MISVARISGREQLLQSGLRGGAQHGGTAVILDELGDRTDAGDQVFPRQHRASSKMMTTARDIVELAAAGGFVCEEGFKKLDVGGDDNGFVPIFGGEAARVDSVVAIIVLKIVLMLQHVPIAQNRAEFLCRLLDDRGVGDHINHAALLIVLGVFKRKGQGGERFAAAGRHGEGKQAAAVFRHLQAAV